jgi:hypothetical protein
MHRDEGSWSGALIIVPLPSSGREWRMRLPIGAEAQVIMQCRRGAAGIGWITWRYQLQERRSRVGRLSSVKLDSGLPFYPENNLDINWESLMSISRS